MKSETGVLIERQGAVAVVTLNRLARREFSKPIVAAVNGVALGGGFEIVLACDLVVADEQARFGLPEVKRGIVAAAGGIIRLSQRIPLAVALEKALRAETIDAETAPRLDLVNRLVLTGEGRKSAIALADRLCKSAPLAVRLTKRKLRRAVPHDEGRLWDEQVEQLGPLLASDDNIEGPRAFIETRRPIWQAR